MSLKHFRMSVISSYHSNGNFEKSEWMAHSPHLNVTQSSSFPLEKIIGVRKCERVGGGREIERVCVKNSRNPIRNPPLGLPSC